MVLFGQHWSPDEIKTLQDNWLLGCSDRTIAALLHGRTSKSVQAKRRAMNLTANLHTVEQQPKEPDKRRDKERRYTINDHRDILARHHSGETDEAIAAIYETTVTAIRIKIQKMLEEEYLPEPKREPISRSCLSCEIWFFSTEPVSTNRLCPRCKSHHNESGPSFLTRTL